MRVRININDSVSVELTEDGKKTLAKHYEYLQMGELTPPIETRYSCSLWQLMMVFGRYILPGGECHFVNNNIEITPQGQ